MASDESKQQAQQAPSAPRKRAGLYADLLATATPDSASAADQPGASQQPADPQPSAQPAKSQHINPATRLFQPIKRPQFVVKPKIRSSAPVIQKPPVPAVKPDPGPVDSAKQGITGAINRPTHDDWAAEDNEEEAISYLANRKRQRAAGRKHKKQKRQEDYGPRKVEWFAIYDATHPCVYEDFKHCEEKYREIHDWKDSLHVGRGRSAGHPRRDRRSSNMSYTSGGRRDSADSTHKMHRSMFAPPASFDNEEEGHHLDSPRETTFAKPPPPAVEIPDDATGEDAYARRMRMSAMPAAPPSFTPPQPVSEFAPSHSATISRAPVRYELPDAPAGLPSTKEELQAALQDEDTPMPDAGDTGAASTPAQKKFGLKMLEKMGWNKGEGLGANASGIVKPLSVQMDKRKKRSDAEGGGFVGPAGKGRIVGGSKSKATRDAEKAEDLKYGQLSTVVILQGMTKGLDLDAEMRDGSLVQDIGDECSNKYGRVERVFVDRDSEGIDSGANVFVKFTAQLSALNAVQALDGRLFNGNTVRAKYYDDDKFDHGNYGDF